MLDDLACLPTALEASVTEQPVQGPSFYTPEDVVAAKIRDLAAARAASAQPELGEPSGSASPAYHGSEGAAGLSPEAEPDGEWCQP